jgi:hypothetical protein
MVRGRAGIGASRAALAGLVVAAVAVAGIAVYLLPGQQPHSGTSQVSTSSATETATLVATSSTTEAAASSALANSTTSSSPQTTTTSTFAAPSQCPSEPGSSYSSANITYTVPPCTSYTFPSSAAQIEVLNSSQVLPYVAKAYYYSVVYLKGDFTSTTDVILDVTGAQVVTGNWTTGYTVSYVGNRLLNITVQRGEPSGHVVTGLLVNELPDMNSSLSFSEQQQRTIQVALSNSTVQTLMTDPPYYVNLVFPEPGGGNQSNVIQMYQVNGQRVINVGLNAADTAVVSAGASTRDTVECDSDGVCVTDPWDVQPLAGVSEPPFVLTVTYSGQWSANVTVYNTSAISPRFLLYSKTFNGTGGGAVTIPWQSPMGGMYVTATVQKTDGGSGTLTATMSWSGTDESDTQSTSANGTSVFVWSSVLTG